jgi:hypothetical protein
MFAFPSPEEPGVRPLADGDQQLLISLVRRYGIPSIMNALTFGEPCKNSLCDSALYFRAT